MTEDSTFASGSCCSFLIIFVLIWYILGPMLLGQIDQSDPEIAVIIYIVLEQFVHPRPELLGEMVTAGVGGFLTFFIASLVKGDTDLDNKTLFYLFVSLIFPLILMGLFIGYTYISGNIMTLPFTATGLIVFLVLEKLWLGMIGALAAWVGWWLGTLITGS